MTESTSWLCTRNRDDPHWACSRCAPKYVCSQHNARCTATYCMWFRSCGTHLHTVCALGCVAQSADSHTVDVCRRKHVDCITLRSGKEIWGLNGLLTYCKQPNVLSVGLAGTGCSVVIVAKMSRTPARLDIQLAWSGTSQAAIVTFNVVLPAAPLITAWYQCTVVGTTVSRPRLSSHVPAAMSTLLEHAWSNLTVQHAAVEMAGGTHPV